MAHGFWVTGAESNSRTRVKALVDRACGPRLSPGCPSTCRWYEGTDLRSKYPKGADPIVLGEKREHANDYGYDPATGMQETKATLCQIRAA